MPQKKYRLAHPEQHRVWQRQFHANNPGYKFETRYKIPYSVVEELLATQLGMCGVCGKPPVENNPLVFDHCHITRTPRGMLHRTCNAGIGQLGDNLAGITLAYEYLMRHQERLRENKITHYII